MHIIYIHIIHINHNIINFLIALICNYAIKEITIYLLLNDII